MWYDTEEKIMWYDTKEGIQFVLQEGLAGLHYLVEKRHEAGYQRGERMKEWCVLGLYYLDSCGNTAYITENPPKNHIWAKDVRPVMSLTELREEQLMFYSSTINPSVSRIPPVEEKCDRCGHGWDFRNIDDFHPRHVDEPYRHERCHRLADIEESQKEFKEIFERAGVPCSSLRMIPNEYDGCRSDPWFIVETTQGPIRIGWRKRVISISWEGSALQHDGRKIFEKEDVTTDKALVHAWGTEKAVEYLRVLFHFDLS